MNNHNPPLFCFLYFGYFLFGCNTSITCLVSLLSNEFTESLSDVVLCSSACYSTIGFIGTGFDEFFITFDKEAR